MTDTVINIKDAAANRDRVAALCVAESILHIYERVFPDDPRLRALLSDAKHSAHTLVSGSLLNAYRNIAQAIVNDAAFVAITTELPEANDITSAAMVADIVGLCLEPEINLELIEILASCVILPSTTKMG